MNGNSRNETAKLCTKFINPPCGASSSHSLSNSSSASILLIFAAKDTFSLDVSSWTGFFFHSSGECSIQAWRWLHQLCYFPSFYLCWGLSLKAVSSSMPKDYQFLCSFLSCFCPYLHYLHWGFLLVALFTLALKCLRDAHAFLLHCC